MSKLKILTQRDQEISIWTRWTRPLTSNWFDLIWIEDGSTDHSPGDSIVVLRPHRNNYQHLLTQYRDRGYRVVVDHMWDQTVDDVSYVKDGVLSLYCNKWFWYNESLWYKNLGYDQYTRTGQATKSFLMLMNLKKTHRDEIYEKLTPILKHSNFSYLGAGQQLNDDTDYNNPEWQRHFNPAWYNDTKFSVVVESVNEEKAAWVTEKTYKPLAYFHPFVVHGTAGTLAHVRSQGFETFDHVIDESYDSELSPDIRFNKVCNIIEDMTEQFCKGNNIFGDLETQQKLQHNHDKFFDTTTVHNGFYNNIIFPLINFIEST
jgi:hypothetical protein